MKQFQKSALHNRLNNAGSIQRDTDALNYYANLLNKISGEEEAFSISKVENLLKPHLNNDFNQWRIEIEEVANLIKEVKVHPELSKDLALMMDLDQLERSLPSLIDAVTRRHFMIAPLNIEESLK